MSVVPRGMAVQEAYRLYREDRLVVNRKYQRKLVWSLKEKQRLIDSILKGYPIPLIILADRSQHDEPIYEIIDGMQRLHAIFSYIEQNYPYNNQYFDINELSRAKQFADSGGFVEVSPELPRLSRIECANFVDYQLAVTIFPAINDNQVTDIFGRINSGGVQLSAQERRQAGITTNFANLIKDIASEIRGDTSCEVLNLAQMPEISIDNPSSRQGYGIKAEDTFWVKQGIISVRQLRASEDEQIIADIAASILLNEPIAASQELYDEIYDPSSEISLRIENALTAYTSNRLKQEIKAAFSILKDTIESFSANRNTLRTVVNPDSRNPIKNVFYAIYMAFFQLVVEEQKSPTDHQAIMDSLSDLSKRITVSAHYAKTEDRKRSIGITKGLMERFFVPRIPPTLGHGPSLLIDFENSIRRSKIETNKYEFKQGILQLSKDRILDKNLMQHLVNTICGIANCSPYILGFLFIGVCDSEDEAKLIEQIDNVTPLPINNHFVVGIEREAIILKQRLDNYVQNIARFIQKSTLSEPLKTMVLGGFDTITYRGLSVLRITIPLQDRLSFVGDECFTRVGSSTIKVEGRQLIALADSFRQKNNYNDA